ncbi:hypothetical protein D5S17_14380 [Pseudonocardiaceae bacterium YIM PH 21723]|nr:hypothetical protein D5S17_14380 [Pseudonocardiaceae bacterium YIM PH 21723]
MLGVATLGLASLTVLPAAASQQNRGVVPEQCPDVTMCIAENKNAATGTGYSHVLPGHCERAPYLFRWAQNNTGYIQKVWDTENCTGAYRRLERGEGFTDSEFGWLSIGGE